MKLDVQMEKWSSKEDTNKYRNNSTVLECHKNKRYLFMALELQNLYKYYKLSKVNQNANCQKNTKLWRNGLKIVVKI